MHNSSSIHVVFPALFPSPCYLKTCNKISSKGLFRQNIVAVNPFDAASYATKFYQPLAFMPERWLDSAATSPSSPFASDKRDVSKHFGGGAWGCLGQIVAWAGMRLIMVGGLVWAFDIEVVRALDWAQQKTYHV